MALRLILSMAILLVSQIGSGVAVLANENASASKRILPELSSAEEYVFWLGCGCPSTIKYDVSKFDGVEKNRLFEVGLKSLKTDYEDAFSREILTRYYEEKKECSEKALYWALKGAEKGSGYCMAFLRWAYANGEGVIEDQVEASKWMHLAAAKGNEQEKKLLHIIRDMNAQCACVNPDHEEGRKRAQEWMKQHSELFFTSD